MDRCVVAWNRPNRRANVLAAIGYDSPQSAGRYMTLAPVSRKTLPEQRLGGAGGRDSEWISAEYGSFNAGSRKMRESQVRNPLIRKWLGMALRFFL